jgi:hypothetical protein
MSEEKDSENEIVASLENDTYFRDWTDPNRLLSRTEIEDAVATVIGTFHSDLPPLPGAEDRAMAKLALYQVVAPYLNAGPMSWSDLLARLRAEEISEVELLLGGQTLSEFLE